MKSKPKPEPKQITFGAAVLQSILLAIVFIAILYTLIGPIGW
jgi:hypothetical protein